MKFNNLIIPFAVMALAFASCEKPIPSWQQPGGTTNPTPNPGKDDVIDEYKAIKEYAAEYTPELKVGVGLTADIYLRDQAYKSVANSNFQWFTTGNAMKHSSVVTASGDLNFSTIDSFLRAVPSDIEIYGHNFLWHTQQKQSYLKSLIAPEKHVVADDGDICANVVTNSGFEDGTNGYIGFWGKYTYAVEAPGRDGSGNAIHITISPDCENQWDAQLFWPLGFYLEPGVTYAYEFYAKSDSGLACQFLGQNESYGGIYKDTFVPGKDWTYFSGEFTYMESDEKAIERVGLQFGGNSGAQIWFDDFKFGEKIEQTASSSASEAAPMSKVTYIYKSAEEKKAILLDAMEKWIKGMAEHVGDRVVAWDVINEPIADGSNAWRGINNVFMQGDSAPVENNGLELNWGADHWYWAYYIGEEYAVKAFQFARKYCSPDAKLFVNDYNLEISPGKLKALIGFVNYIDTQNGSPIVDGIGTQMHVNTSITKEKVDEMFRIMAATGKLVRVTELDVAVGTSTPSQKQLTKQAEVYRMIVESYIENVPAEQRSGITVWTLSDNPAEHEYWLKGDSPNLFDAKYQRKPAYKYFCDGLAGMNIYEYEN